MAFWEWGKEKKQEHKNGNGRKPLFARYLLGGKKDDVNLRLAQASLELIAKSTFEEDSLSEVIRLAFKNIAGIERMNIYNYDHENECIEPYMSYFKESERGIISEPIMRSPALLGKLLMHDPPLGLCWNLSRGIAYTFNLIPDDPTIKQEPPDDYYSFYRSGIITPMVFQKRLHGYVELYGENVKFAGDAKGEPLNLILYTAGVTRMLCTHMRLHTDPLTELSRKENFEVALMQAIGRSGSSGDPLSLIYVDCDHFKHINDTYGHLAGDTVLRHIGRALQRSLRSYERNIFRTGGEEFAIIANSNAETAISIAKRISAAAKQPVKIRDMEGQEKVIEVTLSIGISEIQNPKELFQNDVPLSKVVEEIKRGADSAMYAAKREFGRDCIVVREQVANEVRFRKVS
ncbi:MAG: GGDEF domain-containing protein [Candidatus Micrarchaeia archaeon]